MEERWYREDRDKMVREQIEHRGVKDPRVLEAIRRVPRHLFVPPEQRRFAYVDAPLPIGLGQTISQPYIVAAMTDMLELRGDENVLEVGTGSGYQAAVLGELARSVHTIERHPELAREAADRLHRLDYRNVFVHTGDGTLGWLDGAPYQCILVTAGAPRLPEPLVDQMDEGGILVIPVGKHHEQRLERWRKTGERILREYMFPVAFVPLLGRFGWQEDQWDQG